MTTEAKIADDLTPTPGEADRLWRAFAASNLRNLLPPNFPKIVCLCGSTRFWREFQRANLRETLAGNVVLSIGGATGPDDEHFGNLSREEYDRVKARLDQLHFRKIELADEVLVLNVKRGHCNLCGNWTMEYPDEGTCMECGGHAVSEGYIGESTRREIAHAQAMGKPVRYLNP